MLALKPQKFALSFTCGSVTFIGSFGIMKGPYEHFMSMCTMQRMPFTTIYLGSMMATLYLTCTKGGMKGYAYVLIASGEFGSERKQQTRRIACDLNTDCMLHCLDSNSLCFFYSLSQYHVLALSPSIFATLGVQLVALIWYLISFLPGGTMGLRIVGRAMCTILQPVLKTFVRFQAMCVTACMKYFMRSSS